MWAAVAGALGIATSLLVALRYRTPDPERILAGMTEPDVEAVFGGCPGEEYGTPYVEVPGTGPQPYKKYWSFGNGGNVVVVEFGVDRRVRRKEFSVPAPECWRMWMDRRWGIHLPF
jgi:hypothetical protein